MSKKHVFLQFFSKIAIFACVFCTIPAWSETTCDIDYTPVTGNSIQNGTPTPTAPVEIESVGTKVGNKYQVSITAQGKNLFDSWTVGEIWTTGGGHTVIEGWQRTTNMIHVKPNTTYTIQCLAGSSSGNRRVYLFDSSENYIEEISNVTGTNGVKYSTFTTPSNAEYLTWQVRSTDTEMQLAEESTLSPYVPYSAPTTTPIYLNEPLRKVGDYADVLDYKTGTITRNVGVKVLDGTENWSKNSNYPVFSLTGFGSVSRAGALCTHYKKVDDSTPLDNLISGTFKNHSGTGNVFYFGETRFTDVISWKAYLADQYAAGTPVTIYYPLATPVVERIENWSCTPPITDIKIATTKYVDDEFAPLNTALANAISVVDNVVTQTIAQAGQIATLQNTKQTRPSDDNECPAGKKCLLVTDESGTPHWYSIIESVLPDGYTQLEYITSGGNQYINLGLTANNNTRFEFDLMNTKTNGAIWMCGARDYSDSTGINKMTLQGYSSVNKLYIQYGTQNETSVTITNRNIRHTVGYNGNKVVFDGNVIYTSNTETFTGTSAFLIGTTYGINGNEVIVRPERLVGNWYGFKYWQDGTNLSRNLVPAKRNSDNVVGMYDTVSGTFFENAGSGSFVAGPVVF